MAEGRFVLGLGAGHAQVEFEQAGIPYPPAADRVRRLAAVARVIPRLAAWETIDDDRLGLHQACVGLPVTDLPLIIGGNGEGVLAWLAGSPAPSEDADRHVEERQQHSRILRNRMSQGERSFRIPHAPKAGSICGITPPAFFALRISRRRTASSSQATQGSEMSTS